jgi:hypothetical protein
MIGKSLNTAVKVMPGPTVANCVLSPHVTDNCPANNDPPAGAGIVTTTVPVPFAGAMMKQPGPSNAPP